MSVSFGTVEASGPVTLSKTIKLVNKGVTAAEYSVAYQAVNALPGVEYTVDTPSVKLSPRGTAKVKVTLKITDPKALRKVMDPTMQATQAGLARQFVADASGRVAFTPKSGAKVPLRVSVYAAPKPVSTISTPASVKFTPDATQAVLNLTGKGVDQGSGAQRYRSLISVLELQAESPQLPECDADVVTDCTVNKTAKGGDLRYIGAASTAPLAKAQGEPENAILAFGLSTWGDWANIGSNTSPFVDIDTTGDGTPDFETYVTKATSTDVLLAVTVALTPGFPTVDVQAVNGQLGDVDTNVFDTNVLTLPVSLAALGIDAERRQPPDLLHRGRQRLLRRAGHDERADRLRRHAAFVRRARAGLFGAGRRRRRAGLRRQAGHGAGRDPERGLGRGRQGTRAARHRAPQRRGEPGERGQGGRGWRPAAPSADRGWSPLVRGKIDLCRSRGVPGGFPPGAPRCCSPERVSHPAGGCGIRVVRLRRFVYGR